MDEIYEKNVDTKSEQDIYEMELSKLAALLDAKFDHFEQQIAGLLREPKFYKQLEVSDLASTGSMRSSSSGSTNLSEHIYEHICDEIVYDRVDDDDELYNSRLRDLFLSIRSSM